MKTILDSWNAGFVRRWHTSLRMVEYDDRNHSHQHRVTILLLKFWPDSSREAIINALVHDQGEVDWADVPYPVKSKNSELAELGEKAEVQSICDQGLFVEVTNEEKLRRVFCDRLDSYLWMLRCCAYLRNKPKWVTQYAAMFTIAEKLNVGFEFTTLIDEAVQYYT